LASLTPPRHSKNSPKSAPQNNPFTVFFRKFSDSFQSSPGFKTRQPGFGLLYQDQGGTNAILNRLDAEANHNPNHAGQRLAVWRRVGCRGGGQVPAQADAVSGPRPPAPVVVAAVRPPRPTPTLVGSAIALKLKAITHRRPNHRDPYRSGDASCKKSPPSASPNFTPWTQPIEK
jgi:hypothetical protein